MAIDIKGILHAGTAVQSAGLAMRNAKFATSKKQTPKKFIKNATMNFVGIPLIQTQSKLINEI